MHSRTEPGVIPTRYSWFLISLGTPIIIQLPIQNFHKALLLCKSILEAYLFRYSILN